MNKKLELRMYGLVPYNISPIQQAIQFGHALVEYSQIVKYIEHNEDFVYEGDREEIVSRYNDWADNWKTFVILNGGTSNHTKNRYSEDEYSGTMEFHLLLLEENEIDAATFYEPDLNDMLSAIVFIVDERVFNREDYPDFPDWYVANVSVEDAIKNGLNYSFNTELQFAKFTEDKINGKVVSHLIADQENYEKWLDFIGGKKNAFLRNFLRNFKKA